MRRQLEYKQLWRGGQVLAIPRPTPVRSALAVVIQQGKPPVTKSIECLECGYTANADINRAFCNILTAGHAVLACGGRGCSPDRPSERNPPRWFRHQSERSRDPRPLGRGGCQSK